MNNKVYFALAALVLVALACGINNVPTPTPQSPVIINPQPTTGGSSTGQQILFQDDFSNVNSGWDRTHNEFGSTDYENGGFRINVIQTDSFFFANPYQSLQNDVRIEVDASKIGGPDDNAFGVQCRYQDVDNYYYFYISSDGYAGIGIDNAATKTIISSSDGNLVSNSNIIQGAATNHIRADCIGNNLTLYVNGTKVASATDSTFTGGDVGLVAKTFGVAGTDILFQSFFVYKP
jgi:pectate lyase